MTTKNYTDLTINQILELAAGDLDAAELTHRLAWRLRLDVRARTNGGLTAPETQDLANLATVTDRYLKGDVR